MRPAAGVRWGMSDLRPGRPPAIPGSPASPIVVRKKSYFAAKSAVVLLLTSGGLGYYAWITRGEREENKSGLIAASTARDICEKDLAQTRQQSAALGGAVARTEVEKEREKQARESAEKGLTESQTNLEASQAELQELRRQRAEAEKRLAAFKELTAKFQKMIDTGRLEIGVRDGRMIVKLPAGVLFESGKAELSRDGEMAVMEVAVILRDIPDRKFMVVGHTDSLPPLKTSFYKDNRELSMARALTVTRFMVGAGLKPQNLVAAGYGEYDPVGSNKTEAGKKANRRIEIVLLPSIEELPAMPAEAAAVPAPVPAPAPAK